MQTFGRYGIPFDHEIFERTYSPNWLQTYEAVGLPREKWEEANATWLELYSKLECRLVDGVAEAMKRLAGAGVQQGIVTSGSRSRVERDLKALGITPLLGAVICSEDVTHKKPHPEALLQGLERVRARPSEAAYVGDSPEDVQMARAAGVFSIAIPGKYPNREALRNARADLNEGSLLAAVESLLANRNETNRADREL